MVVDLPNTVDDYLASLGKHTRHEVRSKWRRLLKAHPDTIVEMVTSSDHPDEFVQTMIAWKNQRFNARGDQTVWQRYPHSDANFAELVRRRGRIQCTRIDGGVAAVNFLFPVGTAMYALQSGFDPKYEQYSLGFLADYESVAEAIRTSHRRMSLLWGQDAHKRRFGAKPRRATRLSVFCRQTDRLYSLDEGWEVAWRNLRRNGQREYWRARHAAGRRLRATRTRKAGASVVASRSLQTTHVCRTTPLVAQVRVARSMMRGRRPASRGSRAEPMEGIGWAPAALRGSSRGDGPRRGSRADTRPRGRHLGPQAPLGRLGAAEHLLPEAERDIRPHVRRPRRHRLPCKCSQRDCRRAPALYGSLFSTVEWFETHEEFDA